MKKSFFFSALLAGAVLTGCSNEEPVDNGAGSGDVDANFLSVQLVTNQPGSRAAGDENSYEDGLGTENAVEKVRFYFFYNDGTPAIVKSGANVNYAEWNASLTGETDKPNVEQTLSTTLIIESPKGDKLPENVVAIVNPAGLPEQSLALGDLCEITDNYLGKDKFVMSNSVYADGSNKMVAVSVAGHICTTADAAIASPVVIHVERVLAKVRLGLKLEVNENGLIPAKQADGKPQHDFKGEPIFVKFLGWNVTATSDKSLLVKDINPGWPAGLFGVAETSEIWNHPAFFRSYWAVNPSGLTPQYGDFAAAGGVTSFTTNNHTYLQENASDSKADGTNPNTPSQVIIAAQLVKADGTPLEIAEWGFMKYTVEDLKTAMANNAEIYKNVALAEGEAEHREKIEAEDLTFKTVTNLDITSDQRYWVYAQVADEAVKYCKKDGTPLTVEQVNDELKKLGHAKVWTEGKTYYYFDIKHLGDDKGSKGVVRNHVYDATINTLTGVGTPVYDPDEIIIPEKPEKDDTFIAASIRILSWRIVTNDVDLEW